MRISLPHAAAAAALIGLDQAVKLAVEARLPFQEAIPVAPMLSLFRTWNQGISFSLFAALGDKALIALALAVTAFVLALAARTAAHEWLARAGYTLIVAGALGNLVDRTIYGHVVDYILFHTDSWSFAVFNLADAFISVGAGLVVLQEVRSVFPQPGKSDGD